MNIISKNITGTTGAVFSEDVKVVIVHDGARGKGGLPGGEGDKGDQGDSIVVHGTWVGGTTYCPLDAVSGRSSLVDHVQSLYVQKSAFPCALSLLEPYLNLARWDEIGAVDWDNAFGGIWNVDQQNHGFTKVGQPVGYSFQADKYVLADSRNLDELGICLVREVVDAHRVILQSSGEVPNINKGVITPAGSDWEPGRVYFVSSERGKITLTPPSDSNYFTNGILMASDIYEPGGGVTGRNGIALPWTPQGGPGSNDYIVVGKLKFYFTAVGSETEVTGVDDNGLTLSYLVDQYNTDVFLNGVNLVNATDFTAADGATITFTEPLTAGDIVEIWTADRPLDIIVPSTIVKLDNIEAQFDGVTTDFDLFVGGIAIELQTTMNTHMWMDGNPQEPLVDYTLIDSVTTPGKSAVSWAEPPDIGTRFWGEVLEPVADAANLQARIEALEARIEALEAAP